jgi:hypothetical protein
LSVTSLISYSGPILGLIINSTMQASK